MSWIYSEPTFRMSSEVQILTDASGDFAMMRLCEELVGGRWEPFYTYEPLQMSERSSRLMRDRALWNDVAFDLLRETLK